MTEEAIEDQTAEISRLADEVRLLRITIDEFREDFQHAIRNGLKVSLPTLEDPAQPAERFSITQPPKLTGTDDAKEFCRVQFFKLMQAKKEELHVITLSTILEVINTHRITVGGLNELVVHPREVFAPAIEDAANAIILAHNHPSGDPTPSDEDLEITAKLEKAGEVIGIPVKDHVIIAKRGILSLQEHREHDE